MGKLMPGKRSGKRLTAADLRSEGGQRILSAAIKRVLLEDNYELNNGDVVVACEAVARTVVAQMIAGKDLAPLLKLVLERLEGPVPKQIEAEVRHSGVLPIPVAEYRNFEEFRKTWNGGA